jgi:hypothetical protein
MPWTRGPRGRGVTARSWKLDDGSQRSVGTNLRDPTTSAPVRMSRRPPSISGTEPSSVLVEGSPVTGAGVAVAADGAGVAVAAAGDGDAVAARMTLLTVAVHRTNEPPPFAEPLHWSTFTGSDADVVEPVPTEQMNPTLVPPLPEPLHWPTVAAVTDVTPGVLTGVQDPGAPGPVMTDPMH